MANQLSVGMVGLDTSHCAVFASLLNDRNNDHHIPGGKVTVAFAGGSPDFELSASRVGPISDRLRDEFGVEIVDRIEAVAERSDGILLTSVDGRAHPAQFEQLAPYGKPVFVDKPFAVSAEDAGKMVALAREHHVPVMSASALRYPEGLAHCLQETDGAIIGADCYGPMELQRENPGLYWYGIHAVEMLYRILGRGCERVTATTTDTHDVVTGTWADGRIGTVRGNRAGNRRFGALIHRESGSRAVMVPPDLTPAYARMLGAAMQMFTTGQAPVAIEETWEMMRFIEAANESRENGKPVDL